MRLRNWVLFCSTLLLVVSCSSQEKQLEADLQKAKIYFAPLNDYRSVTCEVKMHLPESFKARKRSELSKESELKLWNDMFLAVESKAFSYSNSMGRCWVRGMKNIKNQFVGKAQRRERDEDEDGEKQEEVPPKEETQHGKFLNNLEAQAQVGSCILLQALYYHSPLSDLRFDRYALAGNAEKGGITLIANNGKSEINWSPESKTLTSKAANDEIFMATYEGEGHSIKIKRAAIINSSHTLSIEEFKFHTLQNSRLVISEYLLSFDENEGVSEPQVRLQFENCVTRIRSERKPLPENTDD